MKTRHTLFGSGALAWCSFVTSPALCGAAIRIWPIDPIIEPGRNASALWLENKGDTPAVMQVRVFGWKQKDGEDVYDPRSAVVASPPVARIAPGSRQLIRLTSTQPQRPAGETAYRVVIDEIPVRATPAPPESNAAADMMDHGIRFVMRYSIPLFLYGAEMKMGKDPSSRFAAPAVICTIEQRDGRKTVRIVNKGVIHARLTDVRFEQGARQIPLGSGLLGYALVGNAIVQPLPSGATGGETLTMRVNDSAIRTSISGCSGR